MKRIFMLAILLITCIIPAKAFAEEINYIDVKIGKSYAQNQVAEITSKENIKIFDENLNEIKNLNTKTIKVSLENGKIKITDGKNVISEDFSKDGEYLLGSSDYLKLENTYRGYLSFRVVNNNLHIVNHIQLEDYLKGVVPKELSPSYPMDALKAQAICSRSFAMKNINKYKKNGYNLDDTTACQVYKGKSAEHERSNKAVDETKGVVALYNNEIANTIFGASSGGTTANAAEVWGGNATNYLSSFEDPYSKEYKWEHKVSKDEIDNILAKNKIDVGEFLNFNIIEKDVSGRNKTIEIIGTEKTEKITGNKFRNIFGNTKLKSTLFDILDNEDEIIFRGSGYGHGVGMSQYGAVEMAKQGKSYTDIITFYFPGVILNI